MEHTRKRARISPDIRPSFSLSGAIANETPGSSDGPLEVNKGNKKNMSFQLLQDRSVAVPDWCTELVEPSCVSILDIFMHGKEVQRVRVDRKPYYIIGRNSQLCDITIQGPMASRRHAAIAHGKDGSVYIVDLNSVHGAYLDNMPLEPLKPVRLRHCFNLTFGLDGVKCSFKHFETEKVIASREAAMVNHLQGDKYAQDLQLKLNTLRNCGVSYRLECNPGLPEGP